MNEILPLIKPLSGEAKMLKELPEVEVSPTINVGMLTASVSMRRNSRSIAVLQPGTKK